MTASLDTPTTPTVQLGDYVYQLDTLIQAFNSELERIRQTAGASGPLDRERIADAMCRALREDNSVRACLPSALLGAVGRSEGLAIARSLASAINSATTELDLGSQGDRFMDVTGMHWCLATLIAHATAPTCNTRVSVTLSEQLRSAHWAQAEQLGIELDQAERMTTRSAIKTALRPIINELIDERIAAASRAQPTEGQADPTPSESEPTTNGEAAVSFFELMGHHSQVFDDLVRMRDGQSSDQGNTGS